MSTMASSSKEMRKELPRMIMPPPPRAAAILFANVAEKKLYWYRSHYDSPESQKGRARNKQDALRGQPSLFNMILSHSIPL
jgi:hypothetical protein